MPAKPYLICSDVHLGAVPERTERGFRDFLDFVEARASGLLINGDLFDFWFEYRTVILRRHYRVVARLADLVERGVPVRFIGGNHDAWAGEFLRRDVGVEVLASPVVLDLAGRRTLVAHGDGVGSGDLGYRALRRVIRHPLSVRAFRAVHPDLGDRIAGLASTTHAKAEGERAAIDARAERIREWAAAELRMRPEIDLVVAGHAHAATIEEVEPGRWYANAGDWLREWTYLELPDDGGAPLLRPWPPAPTDDASA